jgi:hypothetical protein
MDSAELPFAGGGFLMNGRPDHITMIAESLVGSPFWDFW